MRRQMIAGILALWAVLLAAPLWADATIKGVRIWPAPDHTRLVFDLSRPVEHRIFTLSNPERLVIDIERVDLKTDLSALQLTHSPIRRIRSAARNKHDLRVVLDLRSKISPRSFVLKPNQQYGNRLVVDLLYKSAKTVKTVRQVTRADAQKRDIVVAIDAGHGGEDPGALGPGRIKEKDVVLAIARQLEALLRREPGFKPVMVRNGDYYIGLRKRTEIAREHKADLLVSIHADAFDDPRPYGSSVFALSQRGATSATARWLADSENRSDLIGGVGGVRLADKDDMLAGVLLDLSMTASLSASLDVGDKVLKELGRVNRLHKKQVEQAGFVVLKSPDIPSILVETGFISNPKEARKLNTRRHQRALARSMLRGIKAYFERNPPPNTLLAWRKRQQRPQMMAYTIERGDTLSAIAERNRVSLDYLRQINGLKKGDIIRVGQVLRIPAS